MRGAWLILLAAVLWGTTGTAQQLGPDGVSPLAVGSLRLLLGAAALVLVAALGTQKPRWQWSMRPATFVAAVGMAAYQPFFFSGVDRTGVAVGTLLAIGSAPVFVGVLESFLTGIRPTRNWVLATVSAIAGLTILALSQADRTVNSLGALLALAAGLSYAVYTVNAARLAQSVPARQSVASIFSLAALMLVPVALTQDTSFVTKPGGAGMILWLGLAATAAAYLLFTSGLKVTDARVAATLTLSEPLTATFLAVWALGETPGTSGWVGIALIGVGLALATRRAAVNTS